MVEKIPADADSYQRLFERTGVDGDAVLEDLLRRFSSKETYVQGGQDAERHSCYLAGQRSVMDYVLTQINKAKGL
jgi:hypothetical protein